MLQEEYPPDRFGIPDVGADTVDRLGREHRYAAGAQHGTRPLN
jgi:hypothetical protein